MKKSKKIAGHHWGWWVRQLRRNWDFQLDKKMDNFVEATHKNGFNLLLVEAVRKMHGRRAAEDFADTLSW
jgi:hypothetical protein